jgi:hypothetical protein
LKIYLRPDNIQIEQGFISIILIESFIRQLNTIVCFFFVYAETGILKEKKNDSLYAIFLVWYLSIRATLTERGIVLRTHTWPGDLRLNSYRYSRTPGRTSLYISCWLCRELSRGGSTPTDIMWWIPGDLARDLRGIYLYEDSI